MRHSKRTARCAAKTGAAFFLLSLMTCNFAGFAAELAKTDLDFFETKVRPILAEKCYTCHGQDKKIRAGLELTWKGGWEKGGDSGPAIIPGDPEKSLLIKAVRYTDPDLQM